MALVQHYGTGKRKTAVARVYLRPGGSGRVTVNRRTLEEYFPAERNRVAAVAPLRLTGTENELDIQARLHGGGVCAQAEALRHGLSRALVAYKAELHETLKAAGYLRRDAREKERKKYGQPGARKRYQYSKR